MPNFKPWLWREVRLFAPRILDITQFKNGRVQKGELGRGRMWHHPIKTSKASWKSNCFHVISGCHPLSDLINCSWKHSQWEYNGIKHNFHVTHVTFSTLRICVTSHFLRKTLDYFAQGCPFRFNGNTKQIFNLDCDQSKWAPGCSSLQFYGEMEICNSIPAKQFCAFLVVLYSFITLWSSVNSVYDLPGTIAKTKFRIISSRQQLAKINVDSNT